MPAQTQSYKLYIFICRYQFQSSMETRLRRHICTGVLETTKFSLRIKSLEKYFSH